MSDLEGRIMRICRVHIQGQLQQTSTIVDMLSQAFLLPLYNAMPFIQFNVRLCVEIIVNLLAFF